MNKSELRNQALRTRESISPDEKGQKSIQIAQRLEKTQLFKEAERVLFYYSQRYEVQTLELMEKYLETKTLYLPKLTSSSSFIPIRFKSFEELKPGAFGIMEPDQEGGDEEMKLDLIIVPGVAFDRNGGRIGMGKGYYDRFLETKKEVSKVALAFSEQVLEEVPKEPYDENVDMIITEKEIIRCLK